MDSPDNVPAASPRFSRSALCFLAWVVGISAGVLGATAADVLLGTSPFLYLTAQCIAIPALLIVIARGASRAHAGALRRAREAETTAIAQPPPATAEYKVKTWRESRRVSAPARSAP